MKTKRILKVRTDSYKRDSPILRLIADFSSETMGAIFSAEIII
jgi:hypothetical protein